MTTTEKIEQTEKQIKIQQNLHINKETTQSEIQQKRQLKQLNTNNNNEPTKRIKLVPPPLTVHTEKKINTIQNIIAQLKNNAAKKIHTKTKTATNTATKTKKPQQQIPDIPQTEPLPDLTQMDMAEIIKKNICGKSTNRNKKR